MRYKIGDVVICVREDNIPSFIGSFWVVVDTLGDLYLCENKKLHNTDPYPFKDFEIAPASPLLKELF